MPVRSMARWSLTVLVLVMLAHSAQADKFGGAIVYRDGSSVTFHYMGTENKPIDRRIRGKLPQNGTLFFSDLKELHLINSERPFNGLNDNRCTAVEESGKRFTIHQCGFQDGRLGFTHSDPDTGKLKYTAADGRDISHIVIDPQPGTFRKNQRTGSKFHETYNFDPFTGESLIWAKVENVSGSFLLRDGTTIEFARIRPEAAAVPQSVIENVKNVLDTHRGHQPTTLLFKDLEEIHFLNEQSDYNTESADCAIVQSGVRFSNLSGCRIRYSDIPYEYVDPETGAEINKSIVLKNTIKSIIFGVKLIGGHDNTPDHLFPDSYEFNQYTGEPARTQ